MKCAICKGDLETIKEKLLLTVKGQDILIKNLEMLKCKNCGERYLSPETDEKLEKLIMDYKQGKIAVVHQDIIQLEA